MSIKCNAGQEGTASVAESGRGSLLYNRRGFIKAGASGAVSMAGGVWSSSSRGRRSRGTARRSRMPSPRPTPGCIGSNTEKER